MVTLSPGLVTEPLKERSYECTASGRLTGSWEPLQHRARSIRLSRRARAKKLRKSWSSRSEVKRKKPDDLRASELNDAPRQQCDFLSNLEWPSRAMGELEPSTARYELESNGNRPYSSQARSLAIRPFPNRSAGLVDAHRHP